MKNKVLIITHTNDNECVDIVAKQVKKLGCVPVRFNSDQYPENIALEVGSQKGKLASFFIENGKRVNLQDVRSVWYRRSRVGESMKGKMEGKLLSPVLQESQMMLWAAIGSLDAFQLDPYLMHRMMENKVYQLTVAERCGLLTPPNLYTNSAKAFEKFYKQQKENLITKMFSSFALYEEGQEMVVFTTKVEKKHLKQLRNLQWSPMSFQKNIEKKREWRITIVGDKLFSAAVDSQQMPGAEIDWRKEGAALVTSWYPAKLPAAISKKLLKMMDIFHLNYGAMDLIETPKGEFYYLETNSGGEFFWLDHLFNHDVSYSLASLLAGKTKGRKFQYYP